MSLRQLRFSIPFAFAPAIWMGLFLSGCAQDPVVADAPDEAPPELTEEEIAAEEAYARTTRPQ